MATDNAVLSQREIDALLNAEGESEPAPAIAQQSRKEAGRRIKPYDFRHPEKLSKEQIRGLQIIQQAVAGSMAAQFSTRLRVPVAARLSALERGIYAEYVEENLNQSGTSVIFAIVDMNPLQGYAIAAFGLDVAYGMIDRLLGGRGAKARRPVTRDLTDIETALVRGLSMDIAKSLVEPWTRVADLSPDVTEIALGPQMLHAIPPNEFVITAWYEVSFADQTGGVSLCFPLNILEQILPKLTGQTIFESRPNRALLNAARVKDHQIMPMRVPIQALLGAARIPARDIATLQPGDVIVLDREVEDLIRVKVGNCERFAAKTGTRGKRLALQLSGLVDDDGWVTTFDGDRI